MNYFPLTKSQQELDPRGASRPELPITPSISGRSEKEGLLALQLTQDQMTTFRGTAFAGRLPFECYFRDARAGLVMGMANDAADAGMIPIMFPPEN